MTLEGKKPELFCSLHFVIDLSKILCAKLFQGIYKQLLIFEKVKIYLLICS